MAAEIINLRRARKAKARSDAAATAERNRALHGVPKAEREARQARDDLAARRLEGHRRDEPGDSNGGGGS